MDVYLIRHGKAGKGGLDPNKDDERHLTSRGRDEIGVMGKWLKKTGIRFRIIATSPLARARETAEILAECQDPVPPVEKWDCLGIPGDWQELCRSIKAYRTASQILIVGHEPALSDLAGTLTGASSNAAIVFGKGSIAKIRDLECEGSFHGELEWLIPAYLITTHALK